MVNEGWAEEFDTWEPRSAELASFIARFEARASKLAEQHTLARPPPQPFSAELVADETEGDDPRLPVAHVALHFVHSGDRCKTELFAGHIE